MAKSIINKLDEELAAMSANPTKAEVRACFRQVIRYMLGVQLKDHTVTDAKGDPITTFGATEIANLVMGDLIEPSPEGAFREMIDRNMRMTLTGEHHDDGAPVEDPNLPARTRQELPPPPPPRERGG